MGDSTRDLAGVEDTSPPGPPGPPPAPPGSRSIWRVGGLAVLAIGGVLCVALILLAGDDDTADGGPGEGEATSADESSPARGDTDGSRAVSNPTTSTTTTVVLGNPDVPADVVAVADELAAAISDHDWDAFRRLEPRYAGRPDSFFESFGSGWADVVTDTVIPIRLRSPGVLDLGLVAQQRNSDGLPSTSVYCMVWTVDTATRTVHQDGIGAGTAVLVDHSGGWSEPETFEDLVLESCPALLP